MDISGTTRLATVIGSPVRHSLSPKIHNAAFASAGVDAVYVATPVAPGDAGAAVDAMRKFDWLGMSVTMPHKPDALQAADWCTPAASRLGAANCLFWNDGAVMADNTDGAGFVRGLSHDLDVDVAGLSCAVVGAGGAARAVIGALAEAGAERVVVINRDQSRAAQAATHGGDAGATGTIGDLGDCDVVINATPLGMAGTDHQAAMPFDTDALAADSVVCDLIYHPIETPLLKAARERGLRHQNGLAMLVFQAAIAFEHWTGVEAPVNAMLSAVQTELES